MRLAVVQPRVLASPDEVSALAAACVADACLMPGGRDAETIGEQAGLGPVAVLVGDECFEPRAWLEASARGVTWAVLCPGSENEMQAEAALETAIALSDALCGLVVITEPCGAELGEPGHGGSAIILLGDVVAEAYESPETIVGEIRVPVPQPAEPREAWPAIPTILAQRLAAHAGEKPGVAYLADLSDGRLAR